MHKSMQTRVQSFGKLWNKASSFRRKMESMHSSLIFLHRSPSSSSGELALPHTWPVGVGENVREKPVSFRPKCRFRCGDASANLQSAKFGSLWYHFIPQPTTISCHS